MTRQTTNTQLRERLHQEIIASPGLTTRELACRMPAKEITVNVPCNAVCRRKFRWSETETVLEHHPTRHRILTPRVSRDIYRQLRAMESAGEVSRRRNPGVQEVQWVPGGRPHQTGCPDFEYRRIHTPHLKDGLL